MNSDKPILIVFSGLPAAGKSTIARALARSIGAVWLRIDSIEGAIQTTLLARDDIEDAGYRIAHGVADDNLRLGLSVIADCVNGWSMTRNAWRDVGLQAGARVVEVEVRCGDADEHRRRAEARLGEAGHPSPHPSWTKIIGRDYHAWDRERIVIDTAYRSAEDCLQDIRASL
jgi:predicted kinase